MDAAGEQLSRVGMAKIVKPHARHILHTTYEASELVREAERLVRLAIGTTAQKGFANLPHAKREQRLGLLAFQPAQLFDGVAGQGDGTVSAALRHFEPDPCFGLL